jgi:NADH-quinone oxidoreductase subunit J
LILAEICRIFANTLSHRSTTVLAHPSVTTEILLFAILALGAIVSAVLMVVQRNPVMSAILLVANFFCLSLLYFLLQAQLLGILQIAVYAGAIMVLVIFVIMLLNLGEEKKLSERLNLKMMIGLGIAFGVLLQFLYLFLGPASQQLPAGSPNPAVGTVQSMGDALFGPYLLAFEVTSLLLLAAIIGAVVLAKKRL